MKTERARSAFTLIEVLIVIVIMAILAATIIPQFTSSTKDAQDSSVKFNAHTIRAQIELYKAHHLGVLPTIQSDLLPQLTKFTDANGGTSDTKDATHVYGPYLPEIPANPFNNNNKVTAVKTKGTPPTGPAGGDFGWQYDDSTGGMWPNHTGWTP